MRRRVGPWRLAVLAPAALGTSPACGIVHDAGSDGGSGMTRCVAVPLR